MTLYDFCLKKKRMDLLRDFDYERNDKTPFEISHNSDEAVHWVCNKNHHFTDKVSNMILKNSKCPECRRLAGQSYAEKVICFYVKKYFPDTIENARPDWMKGKELDIFIPSLNTAIEYDGIYYHKSIDNDIFKNSLCLKNGVKLIRIRERGLPSLDGCMNIALVGNGHYALKKALQVLFPFLGISGKVPINITKDCLEIRKVFFFRQNKNNVRTYAKEHCPSLLWEWDYIKNTVLPSETFLSYDKEVCFIDEKTREGYKETIQDYISRKEKEEETI